MNQRRRLDAAISEPFRSGTRLDGALILVFLAINGLVFLNACLHDPRIGYDAREHLEYMEALSELHSVGPQDSRQFFAPPLPYLLPALLVSGAGLKLLVAAKFAQLLNGLLSVGSTFFLIKTCQLISPRSSLRLGSLVFLAVLPVYYKTFAQVRGEPYVVFFSLVILYYMAVISKRKRLTMAQGAVVGVSMGLCALSRQWGILLLPAAFLFMGFQWIRHPCRRQAIGKTLCLCLLLALVVGGWFYAASILGYGSATAFNRKPADQFSFDNQPTEFYVGLSPTLLFRNPVRPNFPNQLLPTFYSELWGDYWGYFVWYGIDTRAPKFVNGKVIVQLLSEGGRPSWLETNYETVGAYLGRVNLVASFPSALAMTALLFAGLRMLRRTGNRLFATRQRPIIGFLLLAITTTMAGYFWFLIMYPSIGEGDTIKATYVLQVFPYVGIIVGMFLEHIEERSHLLYRAILIGLSLTFLHNVAALFTHYPWYRLLQK